MGCGEERKTACNFFFFGNFFCFLAIDDVIKGYWTV